MKVRFQDVVLALRENKIHSANCPKGDAERANRDANEGDVLREGECNCWVENDIVLTIFA